MRRSNILSVIFSAMLLSLLLTACSSAPKAEWELSISGAVSSPMTLSYADLAGRDSVKLENVLMRKSQGEDTTNSWEGPSLDALLQEAGVSANAKGVVCTASDGYAMEMTLADLKGGIIALKQDGEWIANQDKGPLRMVVPDKPANHWISQLTEIKVVE